MQAEAPASRLQTWLIRGMLASVFLMAGLIGVGVLNEPTKIEGVVVYSRQSRGHDDSFASTDSNMPPVGGVHHNPAQNCGIYLSPIESEKAVHSMEHGAVWITYRPELPEADIAFLQGIVRSQEYLLLSPFPGQRSPLVLTTWGVQLELQSVHDGRIEPFIGRYRLGPTTPERGASCTGGVGNPLP
jgi:hypothetical protein